MTETKPLYLKIEDQYTKTCPAEHTNSNVDLGKQRYAEHERIASTYELAQEYLTEAREQAQLPYRDVSDKLLALYGQLVGYTHEIITHRDFDSLVLLLALAKLEPDMEVERSLSSNMAIIDAMGETIFYLNSDSVTQSLSKSSDSERVAQIRKYYTIDGGLQKETMDQDPILFNRLSIWSDELHTYQYEAQSHQEE